MTQNKVNAWAALAALCIGFFMIMLDMSILNVAVPALLTDLGANINEVVWVTSAYILAWVVPLLLSGRLGDRFGRRRIFLVGLAVFTAASLWCGLCDSAHELIAARTLQGLGAALITPQTLSFIAYLFPRHAMGKAMGAWGSVAGVATITGPLAGGVLVQTLGWEWIFFVNVPIGIAGIVATVLFVPDWRPQHRHSFDPLGLALSAIGLFALIFGVQNGQHYHWANVTGGVTITEIIALGAIAMIAFVVWQHLNRREPLMPPSLFRLHDFTLGSVAGLAIGIGLVGMMLPLMIYLQNVLGLTALQAALLLAPSSVVSGLLAPFVGKLTDSAGAKYVAATGFAVLAMAIAAIALQAQPTSNPWALLPAVTMMGVGIGCIFTPINAVAMRPVPMAHIGSGSGVYNTFRQLGSVLGSALTGVLLQAQLSASVHAAAAHQAEVLTPQSREPFISTLVTAATTGAQGSAGAGSTGAVRQLATTALHEGVTTAVSHTLWLPVGALLMGVLVCLAFNRHTSSHVSEPEPVPDATHV